jgi:cytosine/adenosine deaminase-related metal-dependent hydrolase
MSVVWCPMASMLFGVGGTIRGRHSELHRAGANVVLGCDSANWTSAFDIGEEAFVALMTAREKTGNAGALLAEDVLEMATVNGARAVGMADRLGSLEAGKRADLVIRREDMPEAVPGLDPIRSVVYSSRSKSVDTVIVDGEVIVENGHSTRFDEEELFSRCRETSRSLLQRMGREPPTGRWPRVV